MLHLVFPVPLLAHYIFFVSFLSIATRVIPLEITWWSDEVSTDTLLPANPPLTSSSH